MTPGPFAWRSVAANVWHGPLRLVIIGLIGIGLTTALSTAASIIPLVSLLGSWDRQQGLATVFAWLALGVVAALAGRDAARRRALPIVWALGSVPVCLYAFVQYAHLDPVAWLHQPLGVVSTLGSSTSAGNVSGDAPADHAAHAPCWPPGTDPRRRRTEPWLEGACSATDASATGGFVALLAAQAGGAGDDPGAGGLLAAGRPVCW